MYKVLFELEEVKFAEFFKNFDANKKSIADYDFLVRIKDIIKNGSRTIARNVEKKHVEKFLKYNAYYLLPYVDLIWEYWDKQPIETPELQLCFN